MTIAPPQVETPAHRRCPWPGDDGLYCAYHDSEWGVPEWDDRALFEKLVLDGFQAGLAWITILRKRDNFRRAFDGFDPDIIARYDARAIDRLLTDAGIVRHRGKIEGACANARAYLALRDSGDRFGRLLWEVVDGRPRINNWRRIDELPTETAESHALSKRLKGWGFRFCGPTITYAFMQATGMVNDHLVDCFRHDECAELGVRPRSANH